MKRKYLLTVFILLTVIMCFLSVSACDREHRHIFTGEWTSDETHHWHRCIGNKADCDEKNSYGEHDFSRGDCICGKENPNKHDIHEYSEEWSFNEIFHWHECIYEGCKMYTGRAKHIFDNGRCVCGKKDPSVTSGLCYALDADSDSYTVCGIGETANADIVIASEYNGKPVTAVGIKAFEGLERLISVTIPSSVKVIHERAFKDCVNLSEITLQGESVDIGYDAFSGCHIKKASVPSDMISIFDTDDLKHLVITSGTEIEKPLGCKNLLSVTIPETMKSIYADAFIGCDKIYEIYNLSRLDIKKGTNSYGNIGRNAKAIHTSLDTKSRIRELDNGYTFFEDDIKKAYLIDYSGSDTELVLPEDYKEKSYEIGDCAFYRRTDIQKVVMSDGITAVGQKSFGYCENMKEIILSNNMSTIGHMAFLCCSDLRSIVLPKSVKNIGLGSFMSCYRLVEIYNLSDIDIEIGSLDNGEIGRNARVIHTSLDTKSRLSTTDDGYIFYNEGNNSYISGYNGDETELILPNSYNGKPYGILSYAFAFCNITSVNIPNNVISVGRGAFYSCNELQSISLPFLGEEKNVEKNNYFGYIFEAERSLSQPKAIPDSLKTIKVTDMTYIGDAFECCENVESIILPDNIEGVSTSAFRALKSLRGNVYNGAAYIGSESDPYFALVRAADNVEDLKIHENAKYICDNSFEDCKKLKNVNMPNGVIKIGNNAFKGCENLSSVILPDSLENFATNAFSSCVMLDGNIYGNAIYLGSKSNPYFALLRAGDKNIDELNVNNATRFICDSAFKDCKNLKNIVISDSVTEMGRYTFDGCGSLTDVKIGNGIIRLDSGVFRACTNLENVVMSSSLNEIGMNVFDGCTSLKSLQIPDAVTKISAFAFKDCVALESVKLPKGLTFINSATFENCESLNNVIIPVSVKTVASLAFKDCMNVNKIYYEGSASQWNDINISENEEILSAARFYYSEKEPTDTLNKYWHYADDGVSVVEW